MRVALAMVGLPARGKSLIAQKVLRYLLWLSIRAKCFNVGNYRRQINSHPRADFFDPANAWGEELRRQAVEMAITDMLKWFQDEDGAVGILDATNSTSRRRKWIVDLCESKGIQVMFVESKCDDEAVILQNITDVKISSPDYRNQDSEEAIHDFRNRIQYYEKVYETINEPELTYVKLINVGSQVIINHIRSYLQSRIVFYLMSLHIKPRSIWLSRVRRSRYMCLIQARRIRVQSFWKDRRRCRPVLSRKRVCS